MDDSGYVHRDYRPNHLPFRASAGQCYYLRSLRQQTYAGKCEMSALRKSLRNPETNLALLGIALFLTLVDTYRSPSRQFTSRAYLSAVGLYQRTARPILGGFVVCRYQPTCSRYSIEAVQRFGFRKDIVLTVERLWRCRNGVPLGTADTVPVRA